MAKQRGFFSHPMAKWGLFLGFLFAVWFGGWFAVARFVDGKIGDVLAGLEQRGIAVSCPEREIIGFPFRLGLRCGEIAVDDAVHGYQVNAGTLRSAAQLYALRENIIELDGPMTFEAGQAQINADWDALRLFAKVARGGFDQLSLTWTDMTLEALNEAARSATGSIHLRPNPASTNHLDLAGTTEALALASLPNVTANLSWDLMFRDGYRQIIQARKAPEAWLREGGGLEIRSMFITLPEGGRMALKGDLQPTATGQISGKLFVGLDDAEGLSRFINAINPELAPMVLNAAQAMTLMGSDETFGQLTLKAVPIDIENGVPTIGFLTLPKLPPAF